MESAVFMTVIIIIVIIGKTVLFAESQSSLKLLPDLSIPS
jgi:hypothetical protein